MLHGKSKNICTGGPPAEMLTLLRHLDKDKLRPRTYVIASTDGMGAQKALAAEKAFSASKVLRT